jgi:hypothetical protein
VNEERKEEKKGKVTSFVSVIFEKKRITPLGVIIFFHY